MSGTPIVAEFEPGDARPDAAAAVAAAKSHGARFLAADVSDGDGGDPEAHVGGRRVSSLAGLHAAAQRHGIGLFLRLTDTRAISGLAAALGAAKEDSSARLRERLVIVVEGERAGRRLRLDAPQFPSALALGPSRGRSLLGLLPLNLQRARSDADDLVVPWGRLDAAALTRLRTDLARRGARLWISGVCEGDVAAATAVGAAGLVVRLRWD